VELDLRASAGLHEPIGVHQVAEQLESGVVCKQNERGGDSLTNGSTSSFIAGRGQGKEVLTENEVDPSSFHLRNLLVPDLVHVILYRSDEGESEERRCQPQDTGRAGRK
jgi:hypothetical protein